MRRAHHGSLRHAGQHTRRESFTIDFYASPTADPSGHGEGGVAGSYTIQPTDEVSPGHYVFSVTLAPLTAMGDWITATATGTEGTSSSPRPR